MLLRCGYKRGGEWLLLSSFTGLFGCAGGSLPGVYSTAVSRTPETGIILETHTD
jgi:hypothetical protein